MTDTTGITLICHDLSATETALVSCASDSTSIEVPATSDGKTIVEIGADAFSACPNLRTLVCPPHATRLHAHALRCCNAVTALTLPRDLDHFERSWLNGCSSLVDLTLPDALESVPAKLFNALRIERLHIGSGTRRVDEAAFHHSTLTSIVVDERNEFLFTDGAALYRQDDGALLALAVRADHYAVTPGCQRIERKAFVYQEALRRVDLPDSLEEIGPYAFMNSGVDSLVAPPHVRRIGEKAFYHCANLRQVKLNEELVSIGDDAFSQTSLEHITIPASTTEIGAQAFAGCEGLCLRVSPDNPHLRADAHGGLYRRVGATWAFKELAASASRSYAVAEGTTEIDPSAFSGNTLLEHVILPEGLTHIGAQAFRGCSSLTSIDIPESLASIGDEALLDSGVTSLYLPEGFRHLGNMTLVTNGARRIASGSTLSRVTVHPDNPRFYTTSGMLCERTDDATVRVALYFGSQREVIIPPEVTAIGPYAFAGARGIRHLHLHNRVSSIGLCGLSVGEAVDVVTIELPEPADGTTTAEIHFPNNNSGRRAMQQAFHESDVDIAGAISFSDHAIAWIPDLYERSRWALLRLEKPFMLSEESRARFTSILSKNFPTVCDAFARHNYTHGFDTLCDLGFLTSQNISDVIERISASHDVAMTGHLLELKHRRMEAPALDFEL